MLEVQKKNFLRIAAKKSSLLQLNYICSNSIILYQFELDLFVATRLSCSNSNSTDKFQSLKPIEIMRPVTQSFQML